MAILRDLDSAFLLVQNRLAKLVSQIVPPKDIEDIVQETYVRVCQVENFERISCVRSFLFKTAKNLALDHVKRSEHRLASGVESEEEYGANSSCEPDDPYRQALSNAEFAEFCEAIRQLPLQCRRVFVLKKVYGYSQREIAETLGISQSTVEKHIATGMRKCHLAMIKKSAGISDSRVANKYEGQR